MDISEIKSRLILASGNNTMEALINFGKLPKLSELADELNKEESPE